MKKMKVKDIKEIIDSNDDLIGSDSEPTHGSNLESRANGTTDYNSKVGHQPFRYDMLGRFGFTMLPFYEGEENQTQLELINDLVNLMDDKHKEFLEYYAKHPNKLKSDYRKKVNDDLDVESDNNDEYAKKIIKVVQKHFENAFDEPENIDEWNVTEDKVVNDWSEIEIAEYDDDNEIKDKKIEKIAGLLNKLDTDDVNKIVKLLEFK